MRELCETAYNHVRDAQAILGMVRIVTFDLYERQAVELGDSSVSRKFSELDSSVRIVYDLLDKGLEALSELEGEALCERERKAARRDGETAQ